MTVTKWLSCIIFLSVFFSLLVFLSRSFDSICSHRHVAIWKLSRKLQYVSESFIARHHLSQGNWYCKPILRESRWECVDSSVCDCFLCLRGICLVFGKFVDCKCPIRTLRSMMRQAWRRDLQNVKKPCGFKISHGKLTAVFDVSKACFMTSKTL